MLSKVVLSSLLGLAAAVPYGTAPLGTGASRKPYNSANGTAPTAITTVITDHVTVTDHVTATDGGCSAPTGLSGGPSGPGSGSPSVSASSSGAPDGSSTQLYNAPSQAPPPQQTFFPAHPPDHDPKNISHLSPATGGNLYFAHTPDADTSADHLFAKLDMDFKKPAVVLENSALIKNVTCTTDGLGVAFDDDEAYAAAKKQWATLGKDFILASHSNGCKNSTGVYTFWDVDDVTFDDDAKACDVKASEVGIDNAANTMTAKWGSYAANKDNSTTQGTPTGPITPVSQITPPPSKRAIEERNWLDDLTDDGKSAWDEATSDVGSFVSDATSKATSLVSDASSFIASHDFSTSFTVDIDAAPKATSADYPKNWGDVQADKLISVSDVDVYAVNCWAKGHADVDGHATIDLLKLEVTDGTFSLKGNMDASLGFGVDAPEGKSFSPFSKDINLVQIPLSPFTIPEIITLGPYINLDAGFSVDMSAAGNMMASVGASMPNFDAEIDFKDQSKSKKTGFEPKFTPEFHAEGTLDLSTTFSLPIELGIGLSIPKIPKFNASVSVTNTPSMTAHANYSTEGNCAHGIGLGLNFADDTTIDVLGLYSTTPQSWTSPEVVGKCIPIGKNDTDTNSTSTAPGGSSPSGNGTMPARPSGTGSMGGLFPNGTSPNGPHGTGKIPFPVGGGNGTDGGNGPQGTGAHQPHGPKGTGSPGSSESGAPFPTGGETSSGNRPHVTGQQSSARVPIPTGMPIPKIPFPHKNGTTTSSSSSQSSSSSLSESDTKSHSSTTSSSSSADTTPTPSPEASPSPTSSNTQSEPTSSRTTSSEDAPDPTSSHKSSDPEPATHHTSKCHGLGCVF